MGSDIQRYQQLARAWLAWTPQGYDPAFVRWLRFAVVCVDEKLREPVVLTRARLREKR